MSYRRKPVSVDSDAAACERGRGPQRFQLVCVGVMGPGFRRLTTKSCVALESLEPIQEVRIHEQRDGLVMAQRGDREVAEIPPTPYGYTLFCDDIRQEVSGQVTLVGVYGADLITSAPFPATLPKLGLRITYLEKPGESTEPVEIRIYLPGNADGEPAHRLPLPADFRSMASAPHPSLSDPFLIAAVLHAEISPLLLQQEGEIKVRIHRGDRGEIRLGALRVHTRQVQTPAAAPS